MDTDERIKVLEEEFRAAKEELQQILLDIRTFQLEAQTPLPADLRRGKLPARGGAEQGVSSDGSR